MQFSYLAGLVIVYFGFCLCVAECVWEPALLSKPYQVQIVLIGIVFSLMIVFTIVVVGMSSRLTLYSFAMRKGTYADGANIEGIEWNAHFTDLRIIITNPVDEEYRSLNVIITPDTFTNKAVVVDRRFGCDLFPLNRQWVTLAHARSSGAITPTATWSGTQVEMHDNAGNIYTVVATDGAQRLTCSVLPGRSSIEIVFAAVTSTFPARSTPTLRTGNADFDHVFGNRPSPKKMVVNGSYSESGRTFRVSKMIEVKDGD
jgi:hypothetical protein